MKNRANINNCFINKLVIGAGNILLSDEGIGPHVVKELEKYASVNYFAADKEKNSVDFLSSTGFIDIGTSSIDIGIYLSANIKKIVIIDCIKTQDYEPGTVFKLGIEDLRKKQSENFSLHQMELVDSLKVLSITDPLPEIIIFGVVPAEIDIFSLDLSQELQRKFPVIIDKILNEINIFFNKNA